MAGSMFPGVAVVTGAALGIGRQVAKSLAAEGCKQIALLDRDEEGLSETARLCKAQSGSVQTFVIPFDVRIEAEVEASMDLVIEEWGRIDYAINCAGSFGPVGPARELNVGEFDKVNNVNYRGTWLCSRAEIIRMVRQEPLQTHDGRPGNKGAIVNVASTLGVASINESVAHETAKAAVISMTKKVGMDYAKDNIRINCVCPGVVDTSITKSMAGNNVTVDKPSLGRNGTAQEVADAILFLCSTKASFIQGATLPVDGGSMFH